MLHGSMIARRATTEQLSPVSPASLKNTIAAIITEAGDPKYLSVPDENMLIGCENRPKLRLGLHASVVMLIFIALFLSAGIAVRSIIHGPAKPYVPVDPAVRIRVAEAQRARDDIAVNRIIDEIDKYAASMSGEQQKQHVLSESLQASAVNVSDGLTPYQWLEHPVEHEESQGKSEVTAEYRFSPLLNPSKARSAMAFFTHELRLQGAWGFQKLNLRYADFLGAASLSACGRSSLECVADTATRDFTTEDIRCDVQ